MNIKQMIQDGEPAVAAAVEALTQPPLRQAGAPATTDALVRQMREALLECLEWLEGEGLEIAQGFPARVAVAAADLWLAEPSAQAVAQPRQVTDEWLLAAAGDTLYLHHRPAVDRLVRACADAWGVVLPSGIGQPAGDAAKTGAAE